MVMEDFVDFLDSPLLDVGGMGVGQPEETLGEMAHDGPFVKELLVIETLGEQFPFGRGPKKRTLIGEDELLFPNPGAGFLK